MKTQRINWSDLPEMDDLEKPSEVESRGRSTLIFPIQIKKTGVEVKVSSSIWHDYSSVIAKRYLDKNGWPAGLSFSSACRYGAALIAKKQGCNDPAVISFIEAIESKL